MSQVSKYLRKSSEGYLFYCPGCEGIHSYRTDGPDTRLVDGKPVRRPKWTFNGDVNRPSFSPSLLYFETHRSWTEADGPPRRMIELPKGQRVTICHLFVRTGAEVASRLPGANPAVSYIDYCSDNPHKLNGKIVPLPELPDYAQGDKYGDGNP